MTFRLGSRPVIGYAPGSPGMADRCAPSRQFSEGVEYEARSWCAAGADVRFSTNVAPLHVGGMVPYLAEALPFFEARFAGLPQVGNCWML